MSTFETVQHAAAAGDRSSAQSQHITVRDNRREPLLGLLHPFEPFRRVWRRRDLLTQFTKRDLAMQHRGTLLGPVWPIAQPLLTLAVYTLLFSVIFEAKWQGVGDADPGRHATFVLYFFCGFLLYSGLSVSANRGASAVAARPAYVNRIVFPVEILPVVVVKSAMVTLLVEAVLLLGVTVYFTGSVPMTAALLPVILVPQLLLMLGVAWWLSALGVLVRDVREVTAVVTRFFFFLTPIFYPIELVHERVPTALASLLWLNPMVTIIESARDVMLRGIQPNWLALGLVTFAAWAVMQTGFAFFCRQRRGFDAAL